MTDIGMCYSIGCNVDFSAVNNDGATNSGSTTSSPSTQLTTTGGSNVTQATTSSISFYSSTSLAVSETVGNQYQLCYSIQLMLSMLLLALFTTSIE